MQRLQMKNKLYIGLAILFASMQLSFSQTSQQKALEAKRISLQKEIAKVTKLLTSTRKEGQDLLKDLAELNQKIEVREKLINAIKDEAYVLQLSINENVRKLQKLQKELNLLKKDYADMILKSYKSKSEQSKLMFLLSSKNFQQAYTRYQYMKQYAAFRKKQGDSIIAKNEEIKTYTKKLESQKKEKDKLLEINKNEQEQIVVEKSKQEVLLKKVKAKEKQFVAEIKKKQAQERKIDAEIERVIKAEIAKSIARQKALAAKAAADAKAAAAKAVASTPTTSTKTPVATTKSTTPKAAEVTKNSNVHGFVLNTETKALANSFESNRGRLPWPVSEGRITRGYGMVAHPTLSGIQMDSKGIHISTNHNADARSVFKGEVLAIQSVGGKMAVYVQHGNYISLYNNLESVYVSKGQSIQVKQALGRIATDKVSGETVLKFQIWKDTNRQNPTDWLSRM